MLVEYNPSVGSINGRVKRLPSRYSSTRYYEAKFTDMSHIRQLFEPGDWERRSERRRSERRRSGQYGDDYGFAGSCEVLF
jgi:hypothetical protein